MRNLAPGNRCAPRQWTLMVLATMISKVLCQCCADELLMLRLRLANADHTPNWGGLRRNVPKRPPAPFRVHDEPLSEWGRYPSLKTYYKQTGRFSASIGFGSTPAVFTFRSRRLPFT